MCLSLSTCLTKFQLLGRGKSEWLECSKQETEMKLHEYFKKLKVKRNGILSALERKQIIHLFVCLICVRKLT